MRLAEFTARVRDDASRFRLHYERGMARHPHLLSDDLSPDEWLRMLVLFIEQERSMREFDEDDATRAEKP